jgi:feruloyl esterase
MSKDGKYLLLAGTVFFWIGILNFSSLAATQSMSCEGLSSISIPDTRITSATAIDSMLTLKAEMGPSPSPVQVSTPFCRVEGILEKEVRFEIWLPQQGWNGRFLGQGIGGYAGYIPGAYSSMANALSRGYATATTDTGHQGNSNESKWALGNPERVLNFGHRAHHLLAQAAKKIIAAYYGASPRQSYFSGCSGGGRQALAEVQHYPEDYDGIIAGASGAAFTRMVANLRWVSELNAKDSRGRLTPRKAALIANAATAYCDAKDGLKDGLIDNPLRCDFDISTLLCPAGTDNDTCLTTPQVETAKKIYSPMRNSAGQEIYPGLVPGTLLNISEAEGGLNRHTAMSADFYKYFVYGDPNWDYRASNFDKDVSEADAKVAPIVDVTDPNLKPFNARGGKLIMYHGWADNVVSPISSLNYYKRVQEVIGEKGTGEFLRIFLAPGMYHCGGGPGPNEFDMLSAIEDWVEKGKAPDRVVASHKTEGKVDRTRPLCPYPQTASYTGSGSPDDAANFICK